VRQLRGTSGCLSLANGAQGLHAGALRQVVGYHVALSHSAHRRKPCHRLHKPRSSACGDTHLERITWRKQGKRRNFGSRDSPRVYHGRSLTANGMVNQLSRPRQQRDSFSPAAPGRHNGDAGMVRHAPSYMFEQAFRESSRGDVRSSNVKRVASAVGEGAFPSRRSPLSGGTVLFVRSAP